MIGQLKHRVDVQSLTLTQGAGGTLTENWASLGMAWASIIPLRGTEELAAMQLSHPVSHRITLRHQPGFLSARRIVFSTRVFQVRAAVNQAENNRFIVFTVEEET